MLKNYPRLKIFLKKVLHSVKTLSPSYRLRFKINRKVAVILPRLNCIDVGASYYPHPAWEVFRMSPKTQWIAVEPNFENLIYVKHWSWPSQVKSVEIGLSQLGGNQTLYVTNVDSGSSLLKPVIEPNMEHRVAYRDYFFPIKEVVINTITLEETIHKYVSNSDPIAIKLDTQGSEFSILMGISKDAISKKFICVELENTLLAQPFMQGSTPFYTVFEFFESIGFELVHLKPIQLMSPRVRKSLKSSFVLNECDAVFLLRGDLAKRRSTDVQLALIGCYISYKLYGEALHMLNHIINDVDSPSSTKSHCQGIYDLLS